MITFSVNQRPRLKHHGEEKVKVVREKYQRPRVQDAGDKWRLDYRDYCTGEPQRRSKVWAKSKVPTIRKAQQLADKFMEEVNTTANDPRTYSPDEYTVAGLEKKLSELTWPHLKKSTRLNYGYFFDEYLVSELGTERIDELTTMQLQVFFNSFIGKLSPYTIKNMHAALRAALSQAQAWGMIDKNPAVGVKLPKKRAVKPPVLLSFAAIKAIIETLPEPTRTIVTLIVFGSMRVGESLALRWNDCLADRVVIDERLYEDDLDDPKTLRGNREVPLDQQGVMRTALARIWNKTKFRNPEDFVFATRNGTPTERRNVLRHIKAAAQTLGLPKGVDFRSFRTMHASLMRRSGARPEVARDNMGHSECSTGLEIYSKTWWDERTAAVDAVVDLVMKSDEKKSGEQPLLEEENRQMLFTQEGLAS